LYWYFTSDFFPVLEDGVTLFFPSIRPAAPFEMRQQKRGLQLQKSGMMRKENNREKRKEIRWRVQLQSLIFLIQCSKNPVIYDDPTPLSSFQYPSSIQSLILTLFDSVLGPKKILRISPANMGKNPSRGQESLLSTLDIQTGIS
jgi:hypothetical protein